MTMGEQPNIDYDSMFALLTAWDTDGDGLVSADDFKQGLANIGFQISAQDADVLCRALDADGSGNIKIESLAELLEAPLDSARDAMPVAPTSRAPLETPALANTRNIPPELRAWEALAAADPAAAAEAIAALPDDQAHALHMALGAAAAYATSYDDEGAPTDQAEAEPDDEASLALARAAHAALQAEGLAVQQQQMMMHDPPPQATGEGGIAACAMAAQLDAPPPELLPLKPPPPMMTPRGFEESADPAESEGGTEGPRSARRRSFGSLAARFSMRSPSATLTPSQLLPGTATGLARDGVGSLGELYLPSGLPSCASGREGPNATSAAQSEAASVCDDRPRPMSRAGSVSFSDMGLDRLSRAGSIAQLSRLGSRSSVSVSFEKRETLYKPEDIATLPQKLGELLLTNHARAVDLFRAMDTHGSGQISRDDFKKALAKLGFLGRPESPGRGRSTSPGGSRSKSPSGGQSPGRHVERATSPGGTRSKSPGRGSKWSRSRDYEREIDELFATFDVNGDGSLDYEELHRLLRVGQHSRMSEYLRASVAGKSLPPQLRPAVSYVGEVAKPKFVAARSKEASARSGPGIALPIDPMNEVRDAEWPPQLRGVLLRERENVIDLFRHWEGVGEGGCISMEHFKAGLAVLGHRVSKADVERLFGIMGSAETDKVMLRFTELRRQLRIIANRACSEYLRSATKQGIELKSSQPRGALMSGVAERLEQTPVPTPQMNVLAALTLASTTHGRTSEAIGGPVTPGSESLIAASPSRSQCRGGLLGGISCSSHYSDGVVGLGADASSGKERALAAAMDAAAAAQRGSASLLATEMWVQQWSRAHYSVLLPELRKWELYPEGLVSFEVFADSLNDIGFPAMGRWNEVESVFYSWEPDEAGRLHWIVLRNRMTGGRLVRVQQAKHTTVSYYKQASRAGEGFGNRSSSRFNSGTVDRVGPGKYSPALATHGALATSSGHSGKLKSTAPRFLKKPQSDAPGPGKYTPRHTLQDGRNEITPA